MKIITNIDYHVIDKCNQNCVCCGHFCSLVPKTSGPKSLEQVENDFRLLEPYSDCFNSLTLTGGECTLHPNLIEIMYMARDIFPNNVINIYTNGTTYVTFHKYIQAIEDNDIFTIATTYPNVGDNINKICDDVDGNIMLIDNPSHFHKTFFSGNECATIDEIINCGSRGFCCQLVDGKLYPCQYAAQFKYFDEYFKGQHKLIVDGSEYIDLHNNPEKEQLVQFQYNSVFDLCKHCLDAKRHAGHYFNDVEWTKTQKELDEWYIDEYKE